MYNEPSPAIADDDTIYVGTNSELHAYDTDGTLKWKVNTGAIVATAIGSDGTIYASGNSLYAISPSGTVKWTFYGYTYPETGSMVVTEDGSIIWHESERLYSVKPDGSENWRLYLQPGSSPAIGGDGTLYVGWAGGSLLALE